MRPTALLVPDWHVEIAAVVLFLVSRAAAPMTGSLVVDGGYLVE